MEKDKVYLQHILDAIRKIEKYVQGMTLHDFLADDRTEDAVVRQLEIIGEAVKNISISTKESHPEIPWQNIADMRNKLIHEYFGVDYIMVWKVVEDDLPIFKEKLQAML